MPGLSYRQSSGLDGNSSTSWRCTPGVSIFIATVRWKNQARTQNETGTRTDAKCHSQFLQYVASRYGMAIPYSYTPIYVSIYIHGTPILPLIAMQIYAKFRDIYALKGKEMRFRKKCFWCFLCRFKILWKTWFKEVWRVDQQEY